MKAIGKIGWILMIGLFTFVFWQPIGFAWVNLFRRDHYDEQRQKANKHIALRVPPGYVMEVGWFFTLAVSTTAWWFWMEAKAQIDPEYDVVNVLVILLHVLLKAYFYLLHTTRYPTGAAAAVWACFAVSFIVLVLAGYVATWKFFWWWFIMPVWLLYVCFISISIAAYPVAPIPTRTHKPHAVGPGPDLLYEAEYTQNQ